jgi:hypothetical protein
MINPAMASLASFSPKKSDNYDPNWENCIYNSTQTTTDVFYAPST